MKNLIILIFSLLLAHGSFASCLVTYTFDDGLKDQYTIAYPMFKEAGLPATFFVIAGRVGDPRGMKSKVSKAEGGNAPFMAWTDVVEMATNGMEIGSHSFSDIKAPKCTEEAVLADLKKSKETIEGHTGVPCVSFAAPNNAKKTKDGASVEAVAKAAGFTGMRTKQKGMGGSATAEKLNQMVADQAKKGGWLVFMGHGLKRGYDHWQDPEELRRHLQWVKTQPDVKVVSFGEAVKELAK